MTPAEKLAKSKPQRKRTGNSAAKYVKLNCRLREAREDLGLSIRDVATSLKMTVAGLWRIEKGADPLLTTATKLSFFYGIPIDQLWHTPVSPLAGGRPPSTPPKGPHPNIQG